MQKAVQQFTSECGRVRVFAENELPLGVFHDFLMHLKGMIVERMVAAHQQQSEQAEAMKQVDAQEDKKEDCSQQSCSAEQKGE